MESKSRDEFNAWFEPRLSTMKDKGIGLIRIYQIKNREWQAWQASRAALVVEFPPAMGDYQVKYDGSDWNIMRAHAVKAMLAVGITVKGEGDE